MRVMCLLAPNQHDVATIEVHVHIVVGIQQSQIRGYNKKK